MKTKIIVFMLLIFFGIGLAAQASTTPEPVDPLNWRVLKSFLESWKDVKIIGEVKGSTVSMANYKMSQVRVKIEVDGTKVTVQIIDGGFAPMAYMSFNALKNFSIDSSDKYVKSVEINGYPGIDQFKFKRNRGSIMLLVKQRLLFQFECRNCKNNDLLKKLAESRDYSIIAKKL